MLEKSIKQLNSVSIWVSLGLGLVLGLRLVLVLVSGLVLGLMPSSDLVCKLPSSHLHVSLNLYIKLLLCMLELRFKFNPRRPFFREKFIIFHVCRSAIIRHRK